MEAWVTSAVEDEAVNKAIVLAGSLRRVRTSKKLAVLTTSGVSKDLREKLKGVFDLVMLLEQESPNGLSLEDYAKLESLSLVTYSKCVYLSPNSLVLRNCDELFRKYSTFAAASFGPRNEEVDSSVFLYVPSVECSWALGKAAGRLGRSGDDFNSFLRSQIGGGIVGLEGQYNVKLKLKGGSALSLDTEASIVNFEDFHPIELDCEALDNMTLGMGPIEKLATELCRGIFKVDVESKGPSAGLTPNQYKTEPAAIIGMSFRLPGANNPDEFWSVLAEGRQCVAPVPSFRWKKEHSHYPCTNRKVEAGFLKDPVDEFDAKFFGISPKEAEFLDPQQRLLHEVTWEAMEDAMIDPLKLKGTQTGVFIGSWLNDYRDMCTHQEEMDFFRTYLGNSIASSAARLSHFLETTGPSVATESACSSAIAAVDMACKGLRNGDCDLAVAGGVNLLLHPFENNGLEFVLSPDFRCKTFDAKANGFARAEACAVLLLKRLSDAVRDGDQVWGLIRGSALAQEGLSRSLGTPTVHSESLAMELALKDAGVHPKEVSYIEAHGTGTPVGDPLETAAIAKAYSEGRTEPVFIGSVKTNVGHTESASGITGIIKVLLSMKNGVIPRHLNLETLNPSVNLDVIPAKIPIEPVPWPMSQDRKRIAGVSSFGISGTDGHAIIEEPPTIPEVSLQFDMERPVHIMKISAKSNESMEELLQKYLDIFSQKGEAEGFADRAYSANVGRSSFNLRTVLVAKNFGQAAKILKERSYTQVDAQPGTSRLCFLFTGQGSQYPNMAKELYRTSPIFKDSFDKCDEVLQKRYQISIREKLWPESGTSGEELSRTLYSQTSIFVVEYCLLKLWESWGVKPDYVLGHSLGEFAAAVAAGALTFEDALMLVAERSRLIDSLPRGKMLVIRGDKKTVDGAISEFRWSHPSFWVDYAALNSPDQTVVAGDTEMIEEFSKFCGGKSLKTIVLASTHAFHSRHMDPILESYRAIASTVNRPVLDGGQERPFYISGMEGALVDLDSINADYWVRHTREKVNFVDACKVVQQQEGTTLFLEVGPHPILSALVMGNIEGKSITCLPSIRRREGEWNTLLDSLSKLYLSDWKGEVDWRGFDKFYNRDKVKLPFYPFNRKPVWIKTEGIRPKVHPLLGKFLSTASAETVYQSSLTLKSADFAQDHVIGSTIIFPGAGFLEMCLAGGHSTVQRYTRELVKPKRPIVLKSLRISNPLAMYESESCKVQTVISIIADKQEDDVSDSSELGYSVGVHREVEEEFDGGTKWIQHASATFLPVASNLPKELLKPLDLSSIQAGAEKSNNLRFYDKLPEVGLRFGPKFQSLESIWKTEKGMLASVKVPEGHGDYLIHPVVADAMIQAVMVWTSKENVKMKLQVPVQIGEFIWLLGESESQSSLRFIYCSADGKGKVSCTLVDEEGTPLASMSGVDFVETTAKLVEGAIQQQTNAMPKIWEEIWKSSLGPMQGALNLQEPETVEAFKIVPEDVRKFCEERNDAGDEEREFLSNLKNVTRLYFLKALYDAGWKPEVGEEFSVADLLKKFKIKDNFFHQIQFFLRSIASAWGNLEIVDEDESTFQIIKMLPTLEQVVQGLRDTIAGEETKREEFRLIKELGENLRGILVGEGDALSILFTEDQKKPSAAKFYDSLKELMWRTVEAVMQSKLELHTGKAIDSYNNVTPSKSQQCRPIYRILEVGSGTGTLTKILLNLLDQRATDFDVEFYMTDVTSAFFVAAEKTLEKYMKHVIFKRFDMEEDPLEQGLCPGYFDSIYALEVLHVAKDIKKTLRNLRPLLKPGGMILIEETVVPDEKITFVFGLLEGYWQYTDHEFRKFHTTLTVPMWREALGEAGYELVSVVPVYENHHGVITALANLKPVKEPLRNLFPVSNSWVVFGNGEGDGVSRQLVERLEEFNRKCFLVNQSQIANFTEEAVKEFIGAKLMEAQVGELRIEGIIYLWALEPETRDQRKISLPFVTLMKLVLEMKDQPRSYVLTRGVMPMPESDVMQPSPGTFIGFCRSLCNENITLRLTLLDLDPYREVGGQVEEVFLNLWVELKQNVAFRNGLRMIPKLSAAKILTNEPLSLPNGCDRFQLVLPQTRVISDLEFAYLEPYSLKEDEVEVQVKAMALNFRDVFTVLKPIAAFEKFNAVGLDYAGVVKRVGANVGNLKVGDRVIGMNLSDTLSLPSHIKDEGRMLVPLRDEITFAEGVTLPAVFSTVLHCLVNVAKMKKGDTVLVHTASGGVGLVAIQLCNYVGAKVIATAGSPRKRAYLRNLGIEHVFHSRTTDFKDQILKVTNGRGVDIVLNSITGPGFKEASLDVLGRNGKFIEMSKLNVWTVEEVKALRPDVFYEVVDLTSLDKDEFERLSKELTQYLQKDIIKPIAYEQFEALNIRGALNYLQKAKHIGKIVCIMPEVKMERSKLSISTPLFNDGGTYLVTGGLGGIGWEVVKWMLKNGAKHIAIVSRSPPKSEVAVEIEKWNKSGKHVQAFAVDVGDFDKCKDLMETLKSPDLGFPKLRGVMHAAGVLQDAILENQNWDTFMQTYNPKVNGSWNLHLLTKDLLLEHFVLFSSMAAILGSPGQTNHSASNSFEDSLASYRKSNGLPATCVNWGNWGEVGVATEVDFPGIKPISTAQGLIALETFLKTQSSHFAVINIDSFQLFSKTFPQITHYIEDIRLLGDTKPVFSTNSDQFWNEVDGAQSREEKVEVFKSLVKNVIKSILKMDQGEVIDDHTEFQSLGIDSLMMLEMKNGLQNIFAGRLTLSTSQFKNCTNTESLANTLVDILAGGSESNETENLPTLEELKVLVREDANLIPDSLTASGLEVKPVGQVKTVLLAGATGTVGPYLLRDLTCRDTIKKVYCLVRKGNRKSGEERLLELLKQMEILDSVDMTKVEVLEGDVTHPKLNLSEEQYHRVSQDVDAVVNSAVRADHTEKYWKAPESWQNHCRNVNVLGTLHLLQFCVEGGKLKHYCHVSTITAYAGIGEDGEFSESWQHVGAFDDLNINSGYILSKHISERLVRQAALRGVPCKAFRLPLVAGDSKTGRVDYAKNHIVLRWLTSMKLGVIHDLPIPFTTIPVDHCSTIMTDIFFNPEAPVDVFNVVQKNVESEQVIIEVAKEFGLKMEAVTYDQFIAKLKADVSNTALLGFVKFYEDAHSEIMQNFGSPKLKALRRYLEEGSNSFCDTTHLTKFSRNYDRLIETTMQVATRDFTYLKNQGVFVKFGITGA